MPWPRIEGRPCFASAIEATARSGVLHDRAVTVRDASAPDAPSIAALHAESWRRHYRGAFADNYLDGNVVAERMEAWAARLSEDAATCTVLAQRDGELVGFAHTELDEDPGWGSLVDNLHVRHGAQRQGIGSLLMAETARRVLSRATSRGLYLWVLEQNGDAQRFYRDLGGSLVERRPAGSPGDVPGRLVGEPMVLRCVWPDARRLLAVR